MFKIRKNLPEGFNIFKREYKASNFMPYRCHWDDNTILTKNNELMRVVKVNGFSFETADDEDLDIKKEIRNSLFKGMGGTNSHISLYFHIIRKKQQAYSHDFNPNMPLGFASYLDDVWREKYKSKQAFVNELYITVICRPIKNFDLLGALLKKMRNENVAEEENVAMRATQEQLADAVSRITNSLREYQPRLLGAQIRDGEQYSEIAKFLSSIVNIDETGSILLPPDDLSKYLLNSRLYFKKRWIEVKCQKGGMKYAGIVSIKEYGPSTWAGILDSFLSMPFEFVITQSFQFTNRQSAVSKMQLQQNRMIQSEDKAVSQVIEISEALDRAMSGEIAFGQHHLTVLCIADNLKTLENNLSLAAVELTNTSGIGVRETINLEPAFWGQLPGNFDYLARAATINTFNLSAYNSFHNYPLGKAKGNHWGDSVTVLDTTSGTPYYFSFHLRDVGHTVIIGPTGSGKTVLLNFLCAQAQKFNPRLFFFDKDRGAEIFLRAINGNYTIIDPSETCNFNPLMLPDTGENRVFLLDWLKLLVTVNGETITAEDLAIINKAIAGNYKLAKKDRKLSNIAPFFGIGGPGSLAGRLAMWHGKGSHAKVFDNNEDAIDFTKARVFGFEMGTLLQDKLSLAPTLSYIFHRINLSLDGSPNMIILDEAWALIDNPVFAPRIKDWLKVLRKLNTFVVFATQSVEDASKSAISDTLIQQTATQIFLPNLKATEAYKTSFMLSQREFRLIKTTDPSSRYFLLKQGQNAVIARVDLMGMDDVVFVLSGRAETVSILDEVRKKYGEDLDKWLPEFVLRVKQYMQEK